MLYLTKGTEPTCRSSTPILNMPSEEEVILGEENRDEVPMVPLYDGAGEEIPRNKLPSWHLLTPTTSLSPTWGRNQEARDIHSTHHASPGNDRNYPEQAEGSRQGQRDDDMMGMLQIMRKEMQQRDQHLQLQLQIIDDHLHQELKKRDHYWEQVIKIRDEEIRKELEERDKLYWVETEKQKNALYDVLEKRDKQLQLQLQQRNLPEQAESSRKSQGSGDVKELLNAMREELEKRDTELKKDLEDRDKKRVEELEKALSVLWNEAGEQEYILSEGIKQRDAALREELKEMIEKFT